MDCFSITILHITILFPANYDMFHSPAGNTNYVIVSLPGNFFSLAGLFRKCRNNMNSLGLHNTIVSIGRGGVLYIIKDALLSKRLEKQCTNAACSNAVLAQLSSQTSAEVRQELPPAMIFRVCSEYEFSLIGKEKQLCAQRLCIITIIISLCVLLILR